MKGGENKQPQKTGYTIVEVMIFLAISSLMFIIAASFIQGKQSVAEFHQSTNDIKTKTDQLIGDVSNGFYPSAANFDCASTSSGNGSINIQQGSKAQGTHDGCTFIGKVIQFGLNNGTDYTVYSLAGAQYAGGASSGNPPGSYAASELCAITNDNCDTGVDLNQNDSLLYGLSVNGLFACTSLCSANNEQNFNSGGNTGAIAFLASPANLSQSGAPNSGPQTVNVAPILSTSIATSKSNMIAAINSYATNPNPNNYDASSSSIAQILICLIGPSANQYAAISLFPNSSQRLATNLQVSSTPIINQSDNSQICPA